MFRQSIGFGPGQHLAGCAGPHEVGTQCWRIAEGALAHVRLDPLHLPAVLRPGVMYDVVLRGVLGTKSRRLRFRSGVYVRGMVDFEVYVPARDAWKPQMVALDSIVSVTEVIDA